MDLCLYLRVQGANAWPMEYHDFSSDRIMDTVHHGTQEFMLYLIKTGYPKLALKMATK